MHIVIVNRWYPPGCGFGGVPSYNRHISRALAEQGHRVTVIAGRWLSAAPEQEVDGGVVVHRLRLYYRWWFGRLPVIGRYMRFLCQLLYSFQAAHKLRRLEHDDRPDIVEFADVEAEGLAYLLRRRRRPVVVRCHTPMFVLRRYFAREDVSFDTALISRLEKFCIRRANALSAPSRDMAETIARECQIPMASISVIPNPVEVADSEERRGDQVSSAFTVLHVGRLQRAKGIEVLARAIPLVLSRVPNARFVFIGAGGNLDAWHHRLESLIGAGGNAGRVLLLGGLNETELTEWYGRADVAVVPSLLYESFSYTCAQAMAAELPVVASRIGGIPETLDHGACGPLAEPGDSKA